MKKTFVLALLALLLFGGLASAQTATSTSTATATATATATPTSTATAVATVTPTSSPTSTSSATATATHPAARAQGVSYTQLDGDLRLRVAQSTTQMDRLRLSGGAKAQVVLRLATAVSNQETVTIGSNVFEFQTITTTTGITTASGEWNQNSNAPFQVTMAAHGLVAGQVLAVDLELFQVLRVVSTSSLVVARGRFGTVAAAHSNGTTIFKGAALAATTDIPVGLITTFTAARASAALTAAINNAATTTLERVVGTTGTVGTNTIYDPGSTYSDAARIGKVVATSNSDSSVLITSAVAENSVLASTETLAGSNNAFSAVTLSGGIVPAIKKMTTTSRVPNATEVALGLLYVPVSYTPTGIHVAVRITSTGVAKAWDGGALISGNMLILDNTGATDWAATDTIYLTVYE